MMNNRYREEEKSEENLENINDTEKVEKELIDDENADKSENFKEDKKLKKKLHHLEEEIKESKEQIETLKADNIKYKDQYLRTLADAENFKKRNEDERIRERKYGSQRLLEKLVSITDIFDKACNMKTEDEMLKNFLIGFQMINTNIQNILEEEGVKKIKIEKMFDPKFMHAMETDYDETKDEGEVLAVLKDGYMYKDRVLVAAMVKVNKKPIEEKNNNQND